MFVGQYEYINNVIQSKQYSATIDPFLKWTVRESAGLPDKLLRASLHFPFSSFRNNFLRKTRFYFSPFLKRGERNIYVAVLCISAFGCKVHFYSRTENIHIVFSTDDKYTFSDWVDSVFMVGSTSK